MDSLQISLQHKKASFFIPHSIHRDGTVATLESNRGMLHKASTCVSVACLKDAVPLRWIDSGSLRKDAFNRCFRVPLLESPTALALFSTSRTIPKSRLRRAINFRHNVNQPAACVHSVRTPRGYGPLIHAQQTPETTCTTGA